MTPAQIAAALALPLGWRRRLAGQAGPGWYACDYRDGRRPVAELRLMSPRIVEGEAWLPASPLAWLEATGQGWYCYRALTGEVTCFLMVSEDGTMRQACESSDPVETALKWMQEHQP